jgi:hypothetical protein
MEGKTCDSHTTLREWQNGKAVMEKPTVPAVRCLVLRRRELNRNLLFCQVEGLKLSNLGCSTPSRTPASSSQKTVGGEAFCLSVPYRSRTPRSTDSLVLGQGCLLTFGGFKHLSICENRELIWNTTNQ